MITSAAMMMVVLVIVIEIVIVIAKVFMIVIWIPTMTVIMRCCGGHSDSHDDSICRRMASGTDSDFSDNDRDIHCGNEGDSGTEGDEVRHSDTSSVTDNEAQW